MEPDSPAAKQSEPEAQREAGANVAADGAASATPSEKEDSRSGNAGAEVSGGSRAGSYKARQKRASSAPPEIRGPPASKRRTERRPPPVPQSPTTAASGEAPGDAAAGVAVSPAFEAEAAPRSPRQSGNANNGAEEDASAQGGIAGGEVQRLMREVATLREQFNQQKRRAHLATADCTAKKKEMCKFLVQVAKEEAEKERDRLMVERHMYGWCRHALPNAQDNKWQGGYVEEEVQRMKERIASDRSHIRKKRYQIDERIKQRRKVVAAAGDEAAGGSGDEADNDAAESREIQTFRMAFLNKEEAAVAKKESCLKAERALHNKRVQRMEAAERSNFRNFPLLSDEPSSDSCRRYQLLNLIGRGGFSEVYRAYDLEANRYCAVKIHELGKDMSDAQRQNYIRRAMREYDIQKKMKHPRVVNLLDCFAISTKAFGTVLELCEGETLDEHMKRYGPIAEKEAKGIVAQVFSGLKYMNTNGHKIIHYDLKPGNLFFHYGEVKIADFGLSKEVKTENEKSGNSIDLTSQGAGTYWYLPPETFFQVGGEPPKISNKVDVWSTGVIFYELLYNKRPFGHNQSQEALLKATMAAANQPFTYEIPNQPKVSNDGKAFLARLLTIDRDQRPDVIEAYNDVYLRPPGRRAPAAAANAVPASAPAGG
eukprot:TRINITY_DN18431_c0_g2_i1.p1 TRINITY_DN18431_c0_g2~~TRINITY_DN18431_c0_g2_i1.p1  ORF type:complete len:668 (-),score=169.45 TRINITY_DN18431_c0_g2_i1:69-2030(-)